MSLYIEQHTLNIHNFLLINLLFILCFSLFKSATLQLMVEEATDRIVVYSVCTVCVVYILEPSTKSILNSYFI